MLLGRLIPAGDQIVGATPVERSEALHVDRNHQVGAGERDPHRVAHHRIDRLAQQPEHRIVDARRRRVAHVDRNHLRDAKALDDAGGDVVECTAVDEHEAVTLDRRKDSRQRHRRAKRRRQRPAVEDRLFALEEVDRHHTEGGGQVVEPLEIVVRRRDAREQEVHLLAVVERGRWNDPFLHAELEA